MSDPFRLSPELFAILSALVEERTGIHHDPQDRSIFADKVRRRATEAGFVSPLDYYYYLRYDAAGAQELDSLIDALVVNETYFFREADNLRALVQHFVKPLAEAGARPRIWCAASSTGEEPLTLAMLLDEAALLSRTEILASDISIRALARAREGDYGSRSLRVLPDGVAGRWMRVEDGRGRVERRLIDAIQWHRINLMQDREFARLGTFDAIICRNVLIYFADATVARVVSSLSSVLRPGGSVLVGASESLMRFGTMLSCEERGGAFFYVRKP